LNLTVENRGKSIDLISKAFVEAYLELDIDLRDLDFMVNFLL
jgi:hypothetical protein